MAEIGETGVTHFHASDKVEWLRSLERLLSYPQLRQTMGESGRKHVVEHYSLSDQADKLASALYETMGQRKAS